MIRRLSHVLLAALVLAALVRCDRQDATEPPVAAAARAVIKESRELLEAGKLRKAQDRLKSVLRELQAQPASDEAQADVYGQLGIVYSHSAKEVEAIAAFESAADLLHRKFKPSDPRISIAANRLADAHAQSGAHVQAVPLYQQLLTAMRAGLGVSHPGYRTTLGKLADSAAAAGRPKVAIKAIRETLDVLRQEPEGSQQAAELAKARVKLARALGDTGAYEEAFEHASAARKLYETGAVSDAESLDHAFSVNAVAGVLEKLGRDEEAIGTMALAAELAAERRPAHDPLVQAAQKNLAGLKTHVARKQQRARAATTRTHDEV